MIAFGPIMKMGVRMGLPAVLCCIVLGAVGVGLIRGSSTVAASTQTPPAAAESLELRRGAVAVDREADPRRLAPGAASRRLRLVQFDRPPDDDDIERLWATGARIVEPVPHNGFLVWTESDAVGQALAPHAIPALRGSRSFDAADVISPQLDGARSLDAAVDVVVQLARIAATARADLAAVHTLAGEVLVPAYEAAGGRYLHVHLRLPGSRLTAVAALGSVVNIEPYVPPRLFGERAGQIVAGALNAAGSMPVGPGYFDFLGTHGFAADPSAYPVVVVVDDGIDNGTTLPLAPDFYELGNPSLPSRVAFSVRPPGANANDPSGPDGHGTINASILAGYSNQLGVGFADAAGYRYGLGIAPFGRFANVRVFTPGFDVGSGNTPMVADYYARGARISSNSWGAELLGSYNVLAQEYDALTRDAVPGLAGSQPMLFVFAGGNAGPTTQTINAPGSAKNVLTVGASETYNPAATAGSGCGDTASDADDVRDMTRFSSRGPTADGRSKPDIVAPGTFVHGRVSQPVFTGYGVCGPATNDFVAPGDDALFPPGSAYTWSAGTSVSTPSISGFAALAHEYLGRVHGISAPSPALLKGFIVHSARHLTGNRANESLPGVHQGFGRADMGFAFDSTAARIFVDQTAVLGNPGDRFELVAEIADPSRPVRAVLTWTDPPGPVFAAAYVNDLDLALEVNGVLYLGNNFSGGVSQPGGTRDSRNNVEAVFLPAGIDGLVRVDVSAMSLSGDGVPGNGDSTDQDFALVLYNVAHLTSRGRLLLDRSAYPCESEIGIILADGDLEGEGAVLVAAASSTGDAEIVGLEEEAPGASVFRATLATASGPVASDGVLQVEHGSVATLTYEDMDDGSGAPAEVTAVATFDCVAAELSDLFLETTSSMTARVTLTTDEPATVRVRYGTSCGQLDLERVGAGPAMLHDIPLTGLAPQTTYYLRIEAADAVGNLTIDDAGGACHALTTPERPVYFVRHFVNEFALSFSEIVFTPNDSASGYTACRAPATAFATSPTGGTTLPLGDDAFAEVTLSEGREIRLFGVATDTFFVGSNGYVTLGAGDASFQESLAAHFAMPRAAALFEDLNPANGGTVSWRELEDRVAITFQGVPVFPNVGSNSFQIELFYEGAIRFTYLGMTAASGVVGLSAGGGIPGDFQPFDFAAAPVCIDPTGRLSFAASLFGCHGSAGLRLTDGDLIGAGTVVVEVESAVGDVESVSLVEDDEVGGVFVGAVPLARAEVAPHDGALQVDSASVLRATYADAANADGLPAVATDEALTLCTDPLLLFQTRRAASAPRFYSFSPLDSSDAFRAVAFKVRKLDRLAVPAAAPDGVAGGADIYLREYRVREYRGEPRFPRTRDFRVANACGVVYLDLRAAEAALVPAALGVEADPPDPEAHRVDHFLCYKAGVQKRLGDGTRVGGLAKGMQLSLSDTLNGVARRYDVRKITRYCTPVATGGNPVIDGGPLRNTPKPVIPATVRNPREGLLCYAVRPARKWIEQQGCGPADPRNRGVTIVPAQPAHAPISALATVDGFASTVSSTRKEVEVCLPALAAAHCVAEANGEPGEGGGDCPEWIAVTSD